MIRRLAADGVPKARIAERLGISRTTVVKAVNSEGRLVTSADQRHSTSPLNGNKQQDSREEEQDTCQHEKQGG